jgi:hypothetical protein
MAFNLQEARSCSEIPACRGPEVLALLIEVNPIQEPELQRYPARVEKFCSNFVIRKIMGDITVLFVEAAVGRMFNADDSGIAVKVRVTQLLSLCSSRKRNNSGSKLLCLHCGR